MMRLPLLLSVLLAPGLASSQEALSPYLEHFLAQPPSPDTVLPFGSGMTRPEQISGELPKYTREALDARVEGFFAIQCTIHVTGEVTDCRVIEPLAYMDTAILKAMKTWRFEPATWKGHPVTVRYTFTGRYTLPAGAQKPKAGKMKGHGTGAP